MNLCKYSGIFGLPGKGLHKYRFMGVAIIDVLFTVLLAIFIHVFFEPNISFYSLLAILFITGIISHRLFCVRTTVDKLLFG